jgi:NAD(P)-dependent dehydrogenase (short-subunit alcohol dehydrogenase family)
VVATARNTANITRPLDEHDTFWPSPLTSPTQWRPRPPSSTVELFGHLDFLVTHAATFQAGFLEEMSAEAFRAQIDTTQFGPVNVPRAALPNMRAAAIRTGDDDLLDRRHRFDRRLHCRVRRVQVRRR